MKKIKLLLLFLLVPTVSLAAAQLPTLPVFSLPPMQKVSFKYPCDGIACVEQNSDKATPGAYSVNHYYQHLNDYFTNLNSYLSQFFTNYQNYFTKVGVVVSQSTTHISTLAPVQVCAVIPPGTKSADIQAALTACGKAGGVVKLQPGVFGGSLSIPSNVKLIGSGEQVTTLKDPQITMQSNSGIADMSIVTTTRPNSLFTLEEDQQQSNYSFKNLEMQVNVYFVVINDVGLNKPFTVNLSHVVEQSKYLDGSGFIFLDTTAQPPQIIMNDSTVIGMHFSNIIGNPQFIAPNSRIAHSVLQTDTAFVSPNKPQSFSAFGTCFITLKNKSDPFYQC